MIISQPPLIIETLMLLKCRYQLQKVNAIPNYNYPLFHTTLKTMQPTRSREIIQPALQMIIQSIHAITYLLVIYSLTCPATPTLFSYHPCVRCNLYWPINPPNWHILGMWEKMRVPRCNPCAHSEKVLDVQPTLALLALSSSPYHFAHITNYFRANII